MLLSIMYVVDLLIAGPLDLKRQRLLRSVKHLIGPLATNKTEITVWLSSLLAAAGIPLALAVPHFRDVAR
jgi:hypothetical protein